MHNFIRINITNKKYGASMICNKLKFEIKLRIKLNLYVSRSLKIAKINRYTQCIIQNKFS